MSGTKVIETNSAASSEQLMTMGRLYRNFPVSPGNSRKGRYETIFVTVAYAIVLNSFVGPSHAAVDLGWPSPSSRTIASPDTTGTSTSSPSAMISEAIETCCRSIPSVLMTPNVIASVIGMDAAISMAVRQLQKPTRATTTTSTSASIKLWLKSSMLSCTCSGWSEVLARTRSAGNDFLTLSRLASTSFPKELICSPFLIWTESVIARVVIQLPFSSRRVNRVQERSGTLVSPVDVHQVPQVERCSVRRCADDHIPQIVEALELARCVDADSASSCVERLTAVRQIPGREDVGKIRRLELVLRQALLREIQKYVLVQYAGAFHLRHDRQRFEASLNGIGKVVQIAIGVLVTCHGLKRGGGCCRVAR